MVTIPTIGVEAVQTIHSFSDRVELGDGSRTNVHVVRYLRTALVPRLVVFPKPTDLVDWCSEEGIQEAVTGGFYLRDDQQLLGETWVDGKQQPSIACPAPWSDLRACLHIDSTKEIAIDSRKLLPKRPRGDLLQAGPLLVRDGMPMIDPWQDTEGFRASAEQFDSDISDGRHPRTAFGYNKDYFWSMVCDGRSSIDAGMTLLETAETLVSLGAEHAINLDGGASSVQVSGGNIRNNPRTTKASLPTGRPIFSALIFEPRTS